MEQNRARLPFHHQVCQKKFIGRSIIFSQVEIRSPVSMSLIKLFKFLIKFCLDIWPYINIVYAAISMLPNNSSKNKLSLLFRNQGQPFCSKNPSRILYVDSNWWMKRSGTSHNIRPTRYWFFVLFILMLERVSLGQFVLPIFWLTTKQPTRSFLLKLIIESNLHDAIWLFKFALGMWSLAIFKSRNVFSLTLYIVMWLSRSIAFYDQWLKHQWQEVSFITTQSITNSWVLWNAGVVIIAHCLQVYSILFCFS